MVREKHILSLSKTFEVQDCWDYCDSRTASKISCIEPDLKQNGHFWMARIHDSANKANISTKLKVGNLNESTLVCKEAVSEKKEGLHVLLEGCIIVSMLEVTQDRLVLTTQDDQLLVLDNMKLTQTIKGHETPSGQDYGYLQKFTTLD